MSGAATVHMASGQSHRVSEVDAGRIKVAMQGVGVLAFEVTIDDRKAFINAASVVLVESIDDELEGQE